MSLVSVLHQIASLAAGEGNRPDLHAEIDELRTPDEVAADDAATAASRPPTQEEIAAWRASHGVPSAAGESTF